MALKAFSVEIMFSLYSQLTTSKVFFCLFVRFKHHSSFWPPNGRMNRKPVGKLLLPWSMGNKKSDWSTINLIDKKGLSIHPSSDVQ